MVCDVLFFVVFGFLAAFAVFPQNRKPRENKKNKMAGPMMREEASEQT